MLLLFWVRFSALAIPPHPINTCALYTIHYIAMLLLYRLYSTLALFPNIFIMNCQDDNYITSLGGPNFDVKKPGIMGTVHKHCPLYSACMITG